MELVIAVVLGALLGGIVMFFVYRNNKAKMESALNDSIGQLMDLKNKIAKEKQKEKDQQGGNGG